MQVELLVLVSRSLGESCLALLPAQHTWFASLSVLPHGALDIFSVYIRLFPGRHWFICLRMPICKDIRIIWIVLLELAWAKCYGNKFSQAGPSDLFYLTTFSVLIALVAMGRCQQVVGSRATSLVPGAFQMQVISQHEDSMVPDIFSKGMVTFYHVFYQYFGDV